MDFIIPITIGLAGSLNCMGKYDLIGATLPLKKHSPFSTVLGAILYNSGRGLNYSLLGIFFGMFGRGLRLAGFQQWISILLGSAMVVSVFYPIISKEKISISGLFNGFFTRTEVSFRRLFTNHSNVSLFMLGILNSLLPCSLVYVAIAGTISSGNVWSGVLFMIIYGIGTIPLLLAATRTGNTIAQKFRIRMQRVVPYFVFMLGLLFILRGMSIGIPFVSPPAGKPAPKVLVEKGSCCK